MGQYCVARWRLSSVVVCNTADGRAGWPAARRAGGRAPETPRRAVVLRPVRATPCSIVIA